MAIVWLVRDYRALGYGRVRLEPDTLTLSIGRRFNVRIPRASVARVMRPTYRDLPTPGTNQGRDYVNLTKPASPNVLLLLREPMSVKLMGRMRREVQRIALHLDAPDEFLSGMRRPSDTEESEKN